MTVNNAPYAKSLLANALDLYELHECQGKNMNNRWGTKCQETERLTRRWPLGRRCLPAPCAGWCCCAPPPTGSCATPAECCTWWPGRGRHPAARRGSRSLPERLFSSAPSGASGLSNWTKEKDQIRDQWSPKNNSAAWSSRPIWDFHRVLH